MAAASFSKPFILQTDASDFGLSAVFSQIGEDKEEHPVAYISRKMLPREQKYSVPEKECLAIMWSVSKLKYYLLGTTFTVMTDHQALRWLEQSKSSNARLMRWYLLLQQFTFNVIYKKGVLNSNADGLSRM